MHYWLKFLCVLCVLCGLFLSCHTKREVNLFIWSAYVSKDVLKKFETQTGIHVNYDTYDSNQVLLEKLRSGIAQYDVIAPTDWMAHELVQLKLVVQLDQARLPNRKNLSAFFQNPPYDPNNAHSIPFLWGTNGIGYDKTKVTDTVDSWNILWNGKYSGKISMLDSGGDCFIPALKMEGHSMNSNDPQQLKEARDLLIRQKPLVKFYNSSNFDESLLSGDVWIAYGYSGQLAKARDQNPNIQFVIPKEGSMLWMDNLAIPVSAPHKDEAYQFLNFCLQPEIAAQITNETGYPNANEASKKFIQPKILNNPARYPDQQTLSRCEWSKDQPEVDVIKDRYWTEVKSK